MPNVGPLEIVIVLIIAVVVLGPKKLPDVGRSLGQGMREFRNSISGKAEESERPRLDESPQAATPVALEGEVVKPSVGS